MYFGLVLPPSGLKFTFFQVPFFLHDHLCVYLFLPLPLVHVWGKGGVCARIGLAALWLAKTWNFLKKYLNCFFFFFPVFLSFNYPPTPLRPPVAMWRMLWQTLALLLSRSAPLGPCCFPTCRRHPPILPPHHTGNQKTSVTN